MTVVFSDLDDEEGRLRRLQGLAAPVVSLASIVVSFLGPRRRCTPGCSLPRPAPSSNDYGPADDELAYLRSLIRIESKNNRREGARSNGTPAWKALLLSGAAVLYGCSLAKRAMSLEKSTPT
jgi:hypothetical protein